MQEHIQNLPSAVSTSDIHAKIKKTAYHRLPDTTTTICQITLENGFIVLGQSACVDPTKYNQALGEKYAFEDAFNKIWPLEGYLLAERRFQSTNL
jgi:hypothetical protein